MANECVVTAGIVCNKGKLSFQPKLSHTFTLTGVQGLGPSIQIIGTGSAELIVIPADMLAEGVSYILLQNTDGTNVIDLWLDSGASTKHAGKMTAGQIALIPAYDQTAGGSPAYYAKATGGSCGLLIAAAGIT